MYYSTYETVRNGWNALPGMEQVMNALLTGGGLEEISEAAARVLGNPFWIVDMNSKMMVPVAGDTANERLLMESEQGYNAAETMEYVQKERVRETASEQQKPYFFITPDTGERILTCPVRIGSTIVAYISTLEERKPLEETDVNAIEVIALVVGTELQKSSFYRDNKEIKYSYFLTDLLESQIDPRDMKNRLNAAGYSVQRNCYLINVELSGTENRQGLLVSIHGQLSTLLRNSMSCMYQNHYIFVFSLPEKLKEDDYLLKRLRRFLQEARLKAAISDVFHNLAHAARNYQKTLDALRLGKRAYPEDALYRYEVLIVEHAMTLVNQQLCYADFCRGAIETLLSYDQAHGSSLLETLQTYLEYVFRITPAAHALSVHVNTLRMRLDKIQSLTGISLENGDQVFELALALRLYRFSQRRDQ